MIEFGDDFTFVYKLDYKESIKCESKGIRVQYPENYSTSTQVILNRFYRLFSHSYKGYFLHQNFSS